MNLFGSSKPKPKQNGQDILSTIKELRATGSMLEKRTEHLEKQVEQCVKKAKASLSKKNKKIAMFELKRKKMFEKEIEGIYSKRMNLEMQIISLESMSSNINVLEKMKLARDTIKNNVTEDAVEEAAEVFEDINEHMQLADELGNLMSESVGGDLLDEDDLEEELAGMEEEMLDEKMLETPNVVSNVDNDMDDLLARLNDEEVPKKKVNANRSNKNEEKEQEMDEMKKLEALMGM